MRRVILPQAVRIVIPPVTNDFIALFKDTSICSMILITELTGLYYQYKFDRGLVLATRPDDRADLPAHELSAVALARRLLEQRLAAGGQAQ